MDMASLECPTISWMGCRSTPWLARRVTALHMVSCPVCPSGFLHGVRKAAMSFFLLMGVPSSREKMRPYGLDRPFTAFSYRRMTSASGGTMGTILPVRDLGLVSAQGPQRGLMSYPSGVSHCASGHRDCFFLLHGYIPFLGPQHPWTSVTVCSFQSNVYVPRRKSRLSRVAPNISPCRFPVSIRHYKMAPSSTGFWNTTSSMARSLGTLKALRPPP